MRCTTTLCVPLMIEIHCILDEALSAGVNFDTLNINAVFSYCSITITASPTNQNLGPPGYEVKMCLITLESIFSRQL